MKKEICALLLSVFIAGPVFAQQTKSHLATAMIDKEFSALLPVCFRYLTNGEAASQDEMAELGYQQRGRYFVRRTDYKRPLNRANSHVPNMVLFETVRDHCRLNLNAFYHPNEMREWAAKTLKKRGFRETGEVFVKGGDSIEVKVLYGSQMGTLLLLVPVR